MSSNERIERERESGCGAAMNEEDKFNKLALVACAPVFIELAVLRMRPVGGNYLKCKICSYGGQQLDILLAALSAYKGLT